MTMLKTLFKCLHHHHDDNDDNGNDDDELAWRWGRDADLDADFVRIDCT